MLSENRIFDDRRFQGGLLFLIAVLIALTGWRTYRNYATPAREFDWSTRGHSDFHNGTYLPTIAFRNGDNPYGADVCEKYTMSRPAPPFSPWVFILHLPFSFAELHAADVCFFIYNTILLIGVGWLAIRLCQPRVSMGLLLLVTVLLLVSRPGHLTLFTGYFTTELAIGTVVALHFARSKPWLAGIGLLLASGKPNFILPLMILMMFRRDYRAVAYGFVFCAIGALAGIAWLASFSGVGEVIDGVREGLSAHEEDPTETPFYTWTRTDLVGMTSKLFRANPGAGFYFLVMLPLLVLPGLAVRRLGNAVSRFGASGLSGSIIAITILLSVYHHTYDCLILIVPWIGVTFFGQRVLPELSAWQRWSVALLTAVPAGNYLSTLSARDKLGLNPEGAVWQSITVISGICLLLALVILLTAAFRHPVDSRPASTTASGSKNAW